MRRLFLFLVLFVPMVCGGCAVFNRNNTPALNFVERKLVPEENPGRALFYPLAIPLGITAVSLDMFLIHPATVVSDAWEDTYDMLWAKGLDWKNDYVTSSVSLIPRAVATPLVAGGSFLARSAFDVPHRNAKSVLVEDKAAIQAREERRKEREKKLTEARLSLEKGDRDTALRIANELLAQDGNQEEATVIKATVLLERKDMNALAAMPRSRLVFADARFMKGVVELLGNGSAVERMQLLVMLDFFGSGILPQGKNAHLLPLLMNALEKNLADGDRAIQVKTVLLLGKYQHVHRQAYQLLEGVAQGNDPVMAIMAKSVLR